MLDKLRKGASGWVAQLFIALLVLSFAVWGVSDIFTGFRSDMVASVGRTDISVATFQRQYDLATRQAGQQLGQPLTQEQARLFGIPGQVLGRLVGDATMSDAARSLGLGVSSETLATQIAQDPTFRGSGGAFDRNNFAEILRSVGLSEDQYINELRNSYVRQQISDALVGGTEVPDAYMKAMHEFRNEERKLGYVVLTATLAGTIPEPTDADLTAYFDAHKTDYRAPEFRAVNVMQMTPAELAKPAEVSDADAKALYDAQVAVRFTTPEQRKVEQIVFKDQAEATAAASALAGGKTFDDLIAERKLKPEDVDLGLVTKDKIIDQKVADAAFALAANTVSGVVDGRFGPVILRVATVQPRTVKTFDEVKDQIKTDIATEKAIAEVADQHDAIEDARAGGETLADIAAKYELKLVPIPALDKEGKDDKGNPVADLPAKDQLVAAAFDTDVGLENEPLPLERGYVWYEVTAVTAERDRTLSDVRDQVITAWKKDQVEQKLTAKANEIRDRLAKGDDIAKVAADNSLEAKTVAAVKRGMQPTGDLTAPAIQAAFGGPKGHAAVAAGKDDQTKIVLVVTETTLSPYFSGAPDLVQNEEQLSDQIARDFLGQYVGQLQSQLGLQINQTALEAAIGQPQQGL